MDSTDAASVWDVVPDDDSLYEAAFQEHFANTNHQVIAIFKALKATDLTADKRKQDKLARQKVGLTTRLMQDTMVVERQVDTSAVDTLRILVITVDKEASLPALHKFSAVLENGRLNYKVSGSRLSLNILKAIHLLPTPPSVKGIWGNILGTVWRATAKSTASMPKLGPGFLQADKSNTPIHYVLPTNARRTAAACVLFLVARAFAGFKPSLHGPGLTEAFVDAWAKRYIVERVPGVVQSTIQKLAFMNPADQGGMDTEWAALTEKEAQHMHGLLDIVQLTGKLDVSMIQERLEEEHAAMEAANVHAILDSGLSIPGLLQKINRSGTRLEDLKFALGVFDGKLVSMREDTEAIESANNALETQVKSLDALQSAVLTLLDNLTAGPEISKLSTVSLTMGSASTLLWSLHALQTKLEVVSPDTKTKAVGLHPAAAQMRVVSDFRNELRKRSEEFMSSLTRRMVQVAGKMQLLTETKPARLLAAPKEVLAYAPLLHMLPTLPGGPDALKEIQSHFLSSVSHSLHDFVNTEVAAAEAIMQETRAADGGRRGSIHEVWTALGALQNILPPVVHCLMLMLDFLSMRATGAPRSPKEGAVVSARAGRTIPGLVMVAMGRLHVLREQGKTMDTLIELRDLMRPTVPVAQEFTKTAAKMSVNLRDPCQRLIRVIASQSYVPLLPFIAALSAWRKYLAPYPAAERIVEELKQVLVDCTQEVQRLRDALIAGADKKEAQMQRTVGLGAVGGDGKNIKGLGVVPKTEALSNDAGAIAEMIRAGVSSLRWWWPWGDELEAMSADDLLLMVHEPVTSVVSAVYSSTLDGLRKTRDKDPKHGTTFMLENLFYLKPAITGLAGLVPDLLARAKDLQTDLNSAQDVYIEEQLQWSKLWPMLLMAGKLNLSLRDLNPREIQFQEGFSRATVLQTIDAGYTDMDKKLIAISQRVRKHLGSMPTLLVTLWSALEKSIILRLRELENDVRACFPEVAMPLAADQVAGYLQAAKPSP